MQNQPGMLGRLAIAIGEVGANISALQGFEVKTDTLDDDLVVNCVSEAHQEQVRAAVESVDGVEVLEFEDRTFKMHEGGKIEVLPLAPVRDVEDLSMAYTPGVARVCMDIAKNPADAHEYTIKRNTVAIVSDGSAVLGLGDIGPEAAMPVMEGKALLLSTSPASTRSRSASGPTRPTRSSRRCSDSSRRSVGSTWRTSPRPAPSRSRSDSMPRWTSRCSTTTSTAPPSSRWPRSRTRSGSWARTSVT
jgi:hypothetical protein